MNFSLKDLLILIRPHHWIKNFLVVAPPFFAGVVFSSTENFYNAFYAFLAFSLISSAGYLINDLLDLENDKNHPVKKNRPLPSGRFDKRYLMVLIPVLAVLSILISIGLNYGFLLITLAYLFVSAAYSYRLKNIMILDVLCISSGFIFRIAAGGLASGVGISVWLYLTTLALSLLLAFGKRRSELDIGAENFKFRQVLGKYSKNFLDTAIKISAAASAVTFLMYAVSSGNKLILITIPFVCFGIFRYLHLINNRSEGEPTDALLRDRLLFTCVFLWIIFMGLIANFDDLFSFIN